MGPKKKRKSKKQQREEELMAERLKKEEAEEKAREAEAKRREIERQRIEAKMKAKREQLEHQVREDILSQISSLFKKVLKYQFDSKIKRRNDEEWERYLRCDRLPYPESPPVMHTYLYLWKSLKETEVLDKAMEMAETVLKLLSILDNLIEEPLDATFNKVNNWKEIRNSYRFELMNKINIGCFKLMRKITVYLNRVDFWTVNYKKSSENIKIAMWGWLDEPVSESDKKNPPSVDFSEIGVLIRLPFPYNKDPVIVVRTIHTTFDHFSDNSSSWDCPPLPEKPNLTKSVSKWYRNYEKLKEEKIIKDKEIKMKLEEKLTESPLPTATEGSLSDISEDKEFVEFIPEEDSKCPTPELIVLKELPKRNFESILSELDENEEEKDQVKKDEKQTKMKKRYMKYLALICPKAPKENGVRPLEELIYNFDLKAAKEERKTEKLKTFLSFFETEEEQEEEKDINQTLQEMDDINFASFKKSMATNITKHELNLRKFNILGGIFYIDLIKHVPQEYKLNDGTVVQMQYGEYNIIKEKFCFVYEPPKIVESSEEEDKPPPDDNIDRLIGVDVTLPQHVLWFEAPTVVMWDEEDKVWSNQHVYDVKFNEEKQVISCRIGRPDPLGLAAVRFNNLPFQTWELRPDWNDKDAVMLSLTASTVILEFLIKDNEVFLQCLQNATGTALESIIGESYSPQEIISIMKKTGVDLFPEDDTFLYVEGHSVKNTAIEEHVYLCMSMFSNVYQFTWSRWNVPAGRNMLVYQTREALSKQSLNNYNMVMTTISQTAIIDCAEVSPAFSQNSVQENSFYPDLYSLLCNVCSQEASARLETLNIGLILTVYEMLRRTKIFSFS